MTGHSDIYASLCYFLNNIKKKQNQITHHHPYKFLTLTYLLTTREAEVTFGSIASNPHPFSPSVGLFGCI